MGLREQLSRSRDLGFLGDAGIEAQLEHAVQLLAALDPDPAGVLVDLGSGGGLPGLVAAVSGDWAGVVLLDRSERRCAFLRSAVSALGLEASTSVLVGEAEVLSRLDAHREAYVAVCARSFGPPATTAECASGLLSIGGRLVISDPPRGRAWPAAELGLLGLEVHDARLEAPCWTSFSKVSRLDDRYPRRSGVPARKPLFSI